jgi:rifampicin phosphotransferase
MRTIYRPGEEWRGLQLGGKARALAVLHGLEGIRIPAWFVVLPEAQSGSSSRHDLGELFQYELDRALAELCPHGEPVAVRSSAPDEDGDQNSFAGQFESFLWVATRDVPDRVGEVRRSLTSERVRAYRARRGLSGPDHGPAVLVQRMVRAEVSGVAFGADPVSGDADVAVVAAVDGPCDALVNGERDAETWHLDRAGRILRHESGGRGAWLQDDQARAIAALARRAGEVFGRPQDIEWAIEGGHVYLLQSRPITTLPVRDAGGGGVHVWDNSNIIESYSGVTTPLTFSFARRAYEGVYREFCRLLAVPQAKVAAHDRTFKRMLGLVRGRVYYNLLNWYRVLALLPGFKINRGFMEQMMGVKESIPDELVSADATGSAGERWLDGWHLGVTLVSLIGHHFRLPRTIASFRRRLDAALEPPAKPLDSMTLDELAHGFLSLESKLLTRWDAPLINDFLAMIFFGVLRGLATRWLNDPNSAPGLLCGDGGMISAEPARRIRQLAALAAAGEPGFAELLREGDLPRLRDAIGRFPEFQTAYGRYLDEFGDRCFDELKLESITLQDDPLPLLRAIGQLAGHKCAIGSERGAVAVRDTREEAEVSVARSLTGHPLRRRIFHWVLKHARARARERENLRFERTRLFARVRRIFAAFGRRLQEQGHLEDARDVFYLEVDELLGFLDGTITCARLSELAGLRKVEFDEYRRAPAPPNRFVTRGPVHGAQPPDGAAHVPAAVVNDNHDPERRQGLGCCPGVVRGPVRKITDPREAVLRAGDIVAAERTDPGWVLLFPAAAGLLVERGSMLSHSAIVARELQVPAVVSVPGLMDWLHEGEWIELDGRTGLITKLAAPRTVRRAAEATAPLEEVAAEPCA